MTRGTRAVCKRGRHVDVVFVGAELGRDEQIQLRRHRQVFAAGEHQAEQVVVPAAVACQITATTMIGVDIGSISCRRCARSRRRRPALP